MHRESLGNYWMTEDRLGLSLFSGGLYDDEFRLVIRIVTVTDYYDIMIARLSVKIWAGLGVLKVPKPEKDWMIELTFALLSSHVAPRTPISQNCATFQQFVNWILCSTILSHSLELAWDLIISK